ncbi:HlyD family efflux transporter periplasmic adaptor subunit [Serratia ureilytica]|uniref:HlyD family secretion protein n=1 Tax=Serratia ureilytica TaxID=300181 RepID=UPI001AA0D064|nr:HlyD family efflux transporter periplasmic adaptor subunit [Serratia ureilytica]MBO1811264.1 HlyD family efflux transporter periplasmic adaptor subunit [Serratia ureilytica]
MKNQFNKCLAKSPLSIRVYVTCIFFTLTVLVFILSQGRYGRQENVKGLVRNEAFYRVSSEKSGNVLDLYVKEGQPVTQGQPLYRLSLPVQKAEHAEGDLQEENLIRLRGIKKGYMEEQARLDKEIETLKSEKNNFYSQLALDQTKLQEIESGYIKKRIILNKQLGDYKILLKSNAINKAEMERLEQSIIDNEMAIKKSSLERQNINRNKSERELYFVKLERESEQNKNDLIRKSIEINREIERTEMQHDYILTSPVDGTVHDVGVLKGDYTDGVTPAVIVKENVKSKPVVILYLTSKQSGLVRTGQKLSLRVDAFPYEIYGTLKAEVINVSKTPTRIGMDEKESWFRTRLNILDNPAKDKISLSELNDGMTVTTTLREDDQSLLEWLFLPVKKVIKLNLA